MTEIQAEQSAKTTRRFRLMFLASLVLGVAIFESWRYLSQNTNMCFRSGSAEAGNRKVIGIYDGTKCVFPTEGSQR